MGKAKDITGRKYGRLTAIEPTKQRKNGSIVWRCKCECGNEVYASRANLEQGHTKSCGCLRSEKVAQRSKDRQTKDISGQKFGRLTTIEPTDRREHGYIIWRCKCECGNEVYVSSHNLVSGNTLSCGCLNSQIARENAKKNIAKFKEENYIAGTRMDIIKNNKLNKNNTTGYKGVYLRKRDGKYTAKIEFQGKKYFLGSYNTVEEAAEARKKEEEKLHGEFLKSIGLHNQSKESTTKNRKIYRKNHSKFIGKKFGKLTVIEATSKRTKSGNVIYRCVCDCGNEIDVDSGSLRSGNTTSCGCIKAETLNARNSKNWKENTNIGYLERTLKDSTSSITRSGVKGVGWNKQMKKWKAYITFQGKNYHLGLFSNVEEAIEERAIAEQKLFGNFLEWYKNNKE